VSSHMNINLQLSIWWEERCPHVIKICTGDPRFTLGEGERGPGLWISIRRSDPRSRSTWNRIARALAAAGQPAPPLMP
jgi:hypothetical protein